jgi:hypothetical protein
MRLTVIHDSEGNIAGLVAYPADAPAGYPAMKPGQLATQVEVPEIAGELDAQKMFERLSDLAENHRVDVDRKAKLTKKAGSKARLLRK